VAAVATFALIHEGGGSAWGWHLVAPALHERGHDAVAIDLPIEDESAGWEEYTDAVGGRRGVVVVGHSLGGFTAPLVCVRIPVDLLVLVAGMIPAPGELFAAWWANVGYEESGYEDVFYHDVPPELAAGARRRQRNEASKTLQEPMAARGLARDADDVRAARSVLAVSSQRELTSMRSLPAPKPPVRP
jgi:pimeloyl-ACP methyl ester carboxylesterase